MNNIMNKHQSWPKVMVRDVCELIQYGYTASATKSSIGPKYLRITDIVPEQIDWDTVPYCEIRQDQISKYKVRTGDIVIARTGATCGYAKRIKAAPPCVFASYLVRLRIKSYVNNLFVGTIIESSGYKNYIAAQNSGAAQPNANAQVLTSYSFDLPPIPIQRKIAAILSTYDDLIENNTRRIKILEEMGQSIYREWFVNFRFPGHEKVRIVDSKLGKIPEGWEVKKMSDLVDTQYGYTETATEAPIGPKFLRGTDINKTSYINWSSVPYCQIGDRDYKKYKLSVGDIFVIRMADPGKVGICEKQIYAIFASYLIRIKLTQKTLSPYYLFYFLLSERYQAYVSGASTGTTRKSASAGVIVDIDIIVPPQDILAQFENQTAVIRQMLNNLLDQISIYRQTRDLLLPRLISGELDVSELAITIDIVAEGGSS